MEAFSGLYKWGYEKSQLTKASLDRKKQNSYRRTAFYGQVMLALCALNMNEEKNRYPLLVIDINHRMRFYRT